MISATGSDEQKAGDFWAAGMDEAKAERLGLTPLKPEMDVINAIATVQDVLRVSFDLERVGVGSFFSFSIGQDDKHSDLTAVQLGQGGSILCAQGATLNRIAADATGDVRRPSRHRIPFRKRDSGEIGALSICPLTSPPD